MIDLSSILSELEACNSSNDTQEFYTKYLGKKGVVASLYAGMKELSGDEKKEHAQKIQKISSELETAFKNKQSAVKNAERNTTLNEDLVDSGMPGTTMKKGYLTLLAKERRRVEEIFQSLGFHVASGHHMVTVNENFESVNIPATHPATEMQDTLYVNHQDELGRDLLMRTHTSAHQTMLIKEYGTPCKFVVPGKVYRNEKMDASHDCVFWQIEGVVIDKGISIAHFKSIIRTILGAILEDDSIEMRMRPGYFPFVEPGFEIDAKYKLKNKDDWLEILGAGMIHPEVLKNADVDPNEYSGFAFGIGLTRLVAIKYGINDIRLLTNGDLRFVQSF